MAEAGRCGASNAFDAAFAKLHLPLVFQLYTADAGALCMLDFKIP